jgi:hypothetical protein
MNPEWLKTHEIPEDLHCKRCQVDIVDYRLKQCGPHLGAFCNLCDQKIKHLSKRKNTNKRKKQDLSKYREEKFSRGYVFCAICYRSAADIKKQTSLDLEVHHIREVQHGGTEDAENLLCVCVDCHNLLHSIRYITHRNANTWSK